MLLSRSTDADWEQWGQQDPYFAVITDDALRQDRLTPEGLSQFFTSGEHHMQDVFARIRRHIDSEFMPKRGLDFGCGTGRLVLPMSARMDDVTGMDISSTMLAETQRNVEARRLRNVRFARSDDNLSQLEGKYDFIHSYIVLQHIPEIRGRVLFKRLIDHMASGGVGALHILFNNTIHPDPFGQTSPSLIARIWMLKRHIRRLVPRLLGRKADPEMQMNSYNLNFIFATLQAAGIREMHTSLQDHGNAHSAVFYFRKP
ncbi:class I SAM-dependent methyltransferase [Asticcacaulis sp. YBE204]|uniref:class I SAM-dependent methyltransferase n=1 Tax=Asticcacaulis sp. YBE204 TaxID=1282363 RepID=UPI0003C3E926|nr:class I SAM-dependent methyltransferase [Asticcacaulis sp. YBE204]ESQ80790.1 hypothetical protein AEYBE204_00275 [Asticcacaulis sp. YBE204]